MQLLGRHSRGGIQRLVSGAAVVACLLASNACKERRASEPQPNPFDTEEAWLSANFGDPLNPVLQPQQSPANTFGIKLPTIVDVRHFVPPSGRRLFNSLLEMTTYSRAATLMSPKAPELGRDGMRPLYALGRVIGQNNCGQDLLLLSDPKYVAQNYGIYTDFDDSEQPRLPIILILDSATVAKCFGNLGGCRVRLYLPDRMLDLVVPSENICAWPEIRGQLQDAMATWLKFPPTETLK